MADEERGVPAGSVISCPMPECEWQMLVPLAIQPTTMAAAIRPAPVLPGAGFEEKCEQHAKSHPLAHWLEALIEAQRVAQRQRDCAEELRRALEARDRLIDSLHGSTPGGQRGSGAGCYG